MLAPCRASSSTIAWPMPLFPPVTMATLFFSDTTTSHHQLWVHPLSIWGRRSSSRTLLPPRRQTPLGAILISHHTCTEPARTKDRAACGRQHEKAALRDGILDRRPTQSM